jgi:hypothetical protein
VASENDPVKIQRMLPRQLWQKVDGFAEVEKRAGPPPAVVNQDRHRERAHLGVG